MRISLFISFIVLVSGSGFVYSDSDVIFNYYEMGSGFGPFSTPDEYVEEKNKLLQASYEECKLGEAHVCVKFEITSYEPDPNYLLINGKSILFNINRSAYYWYRERTGEFYPSVGPLGLYANISCAGTDILFQEEPSVYVCLSKVCTVPSYLNKASGMCEERCPIGSDPKTCELPPSQPSCTTVTPHPISLIDGQKWLRESIYQSSYSDGLSIAYHYNNHANNRFTAYGYRPQFTAGTYVVRSYNPGYVLDKTYVYQGRVYTTLTETQTQAIATHWKHSFDYTVVKTDSGFTLFTPNGSYTQFNISGRSVQYPSQKLSAVNNGYVLSKGTQSFTFNSDGQLIELKEPNRVVEVTYADQQQTLALTKNGQLIETVTIEYDTEHRATRFTFETGHVELAWDTSLTSLTYFDSSGSQYKKRSFNYDDERFPESVTSIDDDYGSGPEQYAYFEYNDEGKAVMSSLAGDVDRLEVEYPTNYQRIVTNSQGYQKKFYLTENDRFRKLAKVEGEATVSCEPSSAEYQYDNDGNLIQSVVNGVTTQYEYENSFETKRVEAVGTENEQVIEIERNSIGLPVLIKAGNDKAISYDQNHRVNKEMILE
jgi:hypothetical protein